MPIREEEMQSIYSKDKDGVITSFVYSDIPQFSEEIVNQLFASPNDIWHDRDLLFNAAQFIAKKSGFAVRCHANYIECTRVGKPEKKSKSSSKREFLSGDMKQDCTWRLTLKSVVRVRIKGRLRNDFSAGKTVKIASICAKHQNCVPSVQNRIQVLRRSGQFSKGIPTNIMYNLCSTMKGNNMRLSTSQIKGALRSVYPTSVNVTKQDIFNTRVRVRRLLKKVGNDDSFKYFEQMMKNSDVVNFIENEIITDDEALNIANEMWIEIMDSSDLSDDGSHVLFTQYLQMIADRAVGFAYEIAKSADGKIVGAVWQTATMRDNFERFGGFISLDVMKRKIHTLLWPYVAVTMRNELEQTCVGAEGIIATERDEAYKFLMNFVLKNTPARQASDIYVLSGDGFFSREMIDSWGLVKTHFILDRYHLFDSILPHRFGKSLFEKLSDSLRGMAYAFTEQQFNAYHSAAERTLISLPIRNAKAEDELRKFAAEKDIYANYRLRNVRGSRNLVSSTPAEQNHSSVLVHLNDGNKSENKYFERPETLIKDLFVRQSFIVNKFNECLFAEHTTLEIELTRLREIGADPMLIEAAETFCLRSYSQLKETISRLDMYQLQTTKDGNIGVFSLQNPDNPPKVFSSVSDECTDCSDKMALVHVKQCVHHLKRWGLQKFLWDKRHFRRQKVTGSITGWKKIDTNIACVENEDIEQTKTSENIYETDASFEIFPANDADNTELDEEPEVSPENCMEVDRAQSDQKEDGNRTLHRVHDKCGKQIPPLSFSHVRNIASDIMATYDKAPTAMKFIAGSMLVGVRDVLSNARISQNDDMNFDVNDIGFDVLFSKVKSMVRTYQSSFLPSTAFCTTVGPQSRTSVYVPHKSHQFSRNKKRLIPIAEKERRKKRQKINESNIPGVHANQPNKQTCSFCKQPGHRITKCPQRIQFKQDGREYSDENDKSDLQKRMELNMPISQPLEGGSIFRSLERNQINKMRHMVIHKCYASFVAKEYGQLHLSKMNFQVSFINELGIVPNHYANMFVSGQCMLTLLRELHSKTRLIFDNTEFNSSDPSLLERTMTGN